jgi:hypothetical protein
MESDAANRNSPELFGDGSNAAFVRAVPTHQTSTFVWCRREIEKFRVRTTPARSNGCIFMISYYYPRSLCTGMCL